MALQCKNDEHKLLTGVYYIPELHNNIISLGQLNEEGCKIMIHGGILYIYESNQVLLARVRSSKNRLYKIAL